MLSDLMICDNLKRLFSQFTESAEDEKNKVLEVDIVYLTHKNIDTVISINSVCLPIQYSSQYYNMVLHHRELCRIAYISGTPVGAICSRAVPATEAQCETYIQSEMSGSVIDSQKDYEITRPMISVFNSETKKKTPPQIINVYVMSLSVLPKYRRLGIGRKLLEWLYTTCQQINNGTYECTVGGLPCVNPSRPVKIESIELHAWAVNEVAEKFYKSMKFELDLVIDDFYCNLNPSTAYHFIRRIDP